MFEDPTSTDNVGGTPPIQLCAKYGSATLRFETVVEAENTLLQLRNSEDEVLRDLVKAVERNMKDLANGTEAATTTSASPSAPAKPTSDKSCPHGQRNLVKGSNAKGDWIGHFCPLKKGDPEQCPTIFGK